MERRMLVFVVMLWICSGYPLDAKASSRFDVDAYLEKYGYLATVDNSAPHRAYSEHTRSHAIRMFQTYAHLPKTGEINRETVQAMQRPRCGFPDVINNNFDMESPLRYTAGPKWKNNTVSWRIISYTDKLSIREQREAIENGLQHWQNSSALKFIETNETANINILFATGYHGDGLENAFDGAGGVLAHAFLPEDGRTHFDNDEFWVFHQSEGAEIEMIATHELGHSLGLSHSVVRGAIMAPFYQQYTDNFTLHADDIAGIQSLYGPPVVADELIIEQHNVATTPTTGPKIILTNVTSEPMAVTKPEINNQSTTSQPKTATTAILESEIVTKKTHPHPTLATPTTTTAKTRIKDQILCETKVDAAIPGEKGTLQLFIGKYIYKIYENCNATTACVFDGYPKKIRKVFRKGPKRVKTAAFLPNKSKRIYLFKGRKMWRYTGRRLDQGYPKQMDKKDIPYKPHAAYIHKNQFADYQWYMFAGKYFWELNLYSETLTNDVMKIKTYWDYVPAKPDAILQTKDGFIYVFKGKYYNKFDHRRVLLERKKIISRDLLGAECL